MRYRMKNGREFTLAAHTPREWGEVQGAKMLSFGCSPEYAAKVAQQYAEAEAV